MREIDLMRVDPCETGEKSDDSLLPGALQGEGGRVDDGGRIDVVIVKQEEAEMSARRRRPGRPAGTESLAKGTPVGPSVSRKRREDEDVCFICFDGGSLVLCDRRGCPKVYHPACVKRNESFFRSRSKWNCGWHICSSCQKDSFYMCYTCPYSACKKCVRTADFACVRGTKGLCGICMKTILLIENANQEDKEKVKVDFDDQSSWEYLFKIYWLGLKEKLSLSLDELTKAKNPWRRASSLPSKGRPISGFCDHSESNTCHANESCGNHAKRRKSKGSAQTPDGTKWATNELLDFVAHMRSGDASARSRYDVQILVMEYIQRNNLLDPLQDGQIICDSKLMSLLGKERVSHFEMLKLLESHFLDQETVPSVNSIGWGDVPSKIEADRNSESFSISAPASSCRNYEAARSKPSVSLSNESSPPHGTGTIESFGVTDSNRIWHYRDPTGKIQGPFSMLQLRQWSTTGHYPNDLRIWRINETQDDSLLLTDVLAAHCHGVSTFQIQNSDLPSREVKDFSSDSGLSANAITVPLDSKRLDVSPNSVCTEASIITGDNGALAAHCHGVSTFQIQNSALPSREVKDFSSDSSLTANANTAQLDNKRLDVSPNSVCTEASIITGNSGALAAYIHGASSFQIQNSALPSREVKYFSSDRGLSASANTPQVDNKRLDVSPNSVCTEASIITGNSSASNKIADSPNYSVPSNERQTGSFLSLWDKPKDSSLLSEQHQVSCSLSLATFPGSSSGTVTNDMGESLGGIVTTNAGRNETNMISEKNIIDRNDICSSLTVQSCGQNWKFTPIDSCSSTVWDSATGFVSLADALNTSKLVQEIDFLDLPSPTLKHSFLSTASDWQPPIVADPNEFDESVSDLLAEVEAMESLKALPPPNSTFPTFWGINPNP